LVRKPDVVRGPLTPEQRLLILDTWQRSGLPARDFSALVGVSRHTLYAWKQRFAKQGPAGLVDGKRGGPRGSRLSEITKRAIVMLKEANPDYGCQRISDLLLRGPALPASPAAVARVLRENGYECEEVLTRDHGQKPRRFERSRANQMWQTDLFSFVLKRQNRRVYLVVFLDDHSRFIVGYGLHATQSAALVLEVLRAAIINYRTPTEVLTDNGSQYVTWRGKSQFARELQRRGIRHTVSAPRHPQTLGKVERFWGSLWRECVEKAVFLDMRDAQRRVGLYIDHYNFHRPHQGIEGLVPADRYFQAAPEVLRTLKARAEANALKLAREGLPKPPFYLTGNAGGQPFSVHAEGERMILRKDGEDREEIALSSSEGRQELPEPLCPSVPVENDLPEEKEEPQAPGISPLDALLDFGSSSPSGEETEKTPDDEDEDPGGDHECATT
jgi:transposase InsO family protein